MHQVEGFVARIRPGAALILLALFLGAAQLAPLTHLASHRNDHSHGPELDRDLAHAAAHEAGRAHQHDDAGATSDAALDRSAVPAPAATSSASAPAAPQPQGTPEAPSRDHGRGSSAHLDLAIVDAPAPPYLPPPAETLTLPADVPVPGHLAPPLPQPSARGPPQRL